MSDARTFQTKVPDLRLVGLMIGSVALVLGVVLVLAARDGGSGLPITLTIGVAVLALLLVAVKRRRVSLADGQLQIVAGINRSTVPVSELLLDRARIINLDEHPEYRPGGLRINGTAMPGYRAGHFINAKGRRSFVLLTSHERVLMLPQKNGRLLLLSLEQPQALLDALAASTAATH